MEFVPYWKRPEGLLFIARRAARRAYVIARGRIDQSLVEDAAQEVVIRFLELPEFNRPYSEIGFEKFAFEMARAMVGRECSYARRERNFSGFAEDDAVGTVDRIYAMHRRTQPEQEMHVYFHDVLRAIAKMPKSMRLAAAALAKGQDIVGYAEDREMSLFDAMNEQKRLRALLRHVLEESANERAEGDA